MAPHSKGGNTSAELRLCCAFEPARVTGLSQWR